MCLYFMTFTLILSLAIATARLTHLESSRLQHHLADCVGNISRTYFRLQRLLVVDSSTNSSLERDILLGRLNSIGSWPIVEEKHSHDSALHKCKIITNHGKAHSYLLLTTYHDVTQLVQRLRSSPTWNSRATFLVILTDGPNNATTTKEDLTRSVLGVLWRWKVINVVVLPLPEVIPLSRTTLRSSEKSNKTLEVSDVRKRAGMFDLYSWFPYHKENQCATQLKKINHLDTWTDDGKFLTNANLFPKKVPNNLRGCPIIASTFHYPPFIVDTTRHINATNQSQVHFDGLEISMLLAIVRTCNLVIDYLPPSPDDVKWGDILPNGSWFGTMGDIYTGRANVTMASLITTKERNHYFDVSTYYLTNAVVWVVPRARFLPRWKSLVKIFSPLFWCILTITFVLSSVLFYLMGNIQHLDTKSQNPMGFTILTTCFTNALAVLLGVSISQPRTFLLRLFFLQWAFYCLLINTAYQSFLISVLTEPGYQKQISSAEELLESENSIGVTKGYSEFITEISTESRFVLCFGTTSCLDHVAYGEEYALVSDEEYARYILPSYVDNTDRSRIKILPDKIMSYYVNMMFPKDSVFLERFNSVIERVNEAGLMEKWRRDVARFANRPVNIGRSANGPIKLSMIHLQGAYAVLIAGLVFSLVVFLGEVVGTCLCRHFTKKRKRK